MFLKNKTCLKIIPKLVSFKHLLTFPLYLDFFYKKKIVLYYAPITDHQSLITWNLCTTFSPIYFNGIM